MIETISRPVTIKKVTKIRLTFVASARLSLTAILLFQALLSLLTLHNTAFQDEALYLLAGKQIINHWMGGPVVLDPYAQYFSGYPYFYPIIGGMLDKLGGLEAARLFSLFCMLGVTASAYYATKKIFDRNAAIWAAALFACQSPVLLMGRLATYDALCLLLLALATVVALYVSRARTPWAAFGLGPLLILAVTAKYAGLLFIPSIFALLILCSATWQGIWKMLQRASMALLSLIVVAGLAIMGMDKTVFLGISATTTNRVATVHNSSLVLLSHIGTLGGCAFALALLGLALVGKKRLLISLLLFGSSLLAPMYHLYKGELVSLDKHLAFSMFFITPLIGYAVAYLAGYRPGRRSGRYWIAGLAIFLLVFSLALQQAQSLYTQWAPSNNMTYLLRTQVRPASGRYLAEDYDVSRYYLQDVSRTWQWNSLDFFTYTDKAHQQTSGPEAYKTAIHDGYFDMVELSYGYNAALAQSINGELTASHRYDLVTKIPYHNAYGNGYYWVWRKHIS